MVVVELMKLLFMIVFNWVRFDVFILWKKVLGNISINFGYCLGYIWNDI